MGKNDENPQRQTHCRNAIFQKRFETTRFHKTIRTKENETYRLRGKKNNP
jgi:hypothetical protein